MTHAKVQNQVRDLRKDRGLTQDQLAQQVGIARVSIIAIENGKYLPTIETALKISQALNQPIEIIFQLRGGV
ncbi:MAG: helix-turn-helix transcriptional regulator [Candidatus Marinimicrobia bacterium]|nr:helix-turn-helix transcriptional regulator [Candidatus Neomarinimicrobiota bacterium]